LIERQDLEHPDSEVLWEQKPAMNNKNKRSKRQMDDQSSASTRAASPCVPSHDFLSEREFKKANRKYAKEPSNLILGSQDE